MHTIKITPNLLFEYQCTSGKFIRLPNQTEKIVSVARIESKLFLPELECSSVQYCRKLHCLLPNPSALAAVSKGMQAVKLCTNKNPPVLNWRCQLMHV